MNLIVQILPEQVDTEEVLELDYPEAIPVMLPINADSVQIASCRL